MAKMTSVWMKNGDISILFTVQGTDGSSTGCRVGDQDVGNPGRTVSSGLQVPGEQGHFLARTTHPW